MDQDLLSRCALGNHSLVIKVLEELGTHAPRWIFSSTRLPRLHVL